MPFFRVMVDDAAHILVIDRPKGWLQELGEWGRRNGVELVRLDDLDDGRNALAGGKYACGIVNVSFVGLTVFDYAEQGRRPWIVISDEPWLEAATRAVESSAAAYLHEPIRAEALIEKIGGAFLRDSAKRPGAQAAERDAAQNHFDLLMRDLEGVSVRAKMSGEHLVDLTTRNLMHAAWDLRQVCLGAFGERDERPPCHLFNCPELGTLREALRESIRVLERTKSAFKSQELAELRKRLEALMETERR